MTKLSRKNILIICVFCTDFSLKNDYLTIKTFFCYQYLLFIQKDLNITDINSIILRKMSLTSIKL